VLLSVVAHGLSAAPLAARYGAAQARRTRGAETGGPEMLSDLPVRGLPRRQRGSAR
jgi:sodium/hydrogen antiporter